MGFLKDLFKKKKPEPVQSSANPYEHYWERERREKIAMKYENETADVLKLFQDLQTKAGGIHMSYQEKLKYEGVKYLSESNWKKNPEKKHVLRLKWEFHKYFPIWEEGEVICFNYFERQKSGRYYFGRDEDDLFFLVTEVRFDEFGGSDQQPCIYMQLEFIDGEFSK